MLNRVQHVRDCFVSGAERAALKADLDGLAFRADVGIEVDVLVLLTRPVHDIPAGRATARPRWHPQRA